MQACKAEPLYLTATRRIAIAQARALPRGNPAPRVMTRRGRSPGSRLGRGPRLPGLAPSGSFGTRSPITGAGVASASHPIPRPGVSDRDFSRDEVRQYALNSGEPTLSKKTLKVQNRLHQHT